MKLTHLEELALAAIQDAQYNSGRLSVSIEAAYDYCPSHVEWDAFTLAVRGLERMSCIDVTGSRLCLTTKGREVTA